MSKGDATGDTPDITRVVLDNREKTVVGRVKYTDVAEVVRQEFRIKWDSSSAVAGYRMMARDFDPESAGFEFELWRCVGGECYDGDDDRMECKNLTGSRDFGDDILNVRVPRECLIYAAPKLKARAFAKTSDDSTDETAFTPYAKKG